MKRYMQELFKIEVIIYNIIINVTSVLWIFFNLIYTWLPRPFINMLEDTHVQGVFKGTTGIIIGIFLVIQKCYDMLSSRRKYKEIAEKNSLFELYYLSGIRFMEYRLYTNAITEFEKAKELNFDNDRANEKIEKCKVLQNNEQE